MSPNVRSTTRTNPGSSSVPARARKVSSGPPGVAGTERRHDREVVAGAVAPGHLVRVGRAADVAENAGVVNVGALEALHAGGRRQANGIERGSQGGLGAQTRREIGREREA